MPPQPHRQVRRTRLILDEARALPRALLLIPLLLCLGTLPARAGSWTFTCTGSGSNTATALATNRDNHPTTYWTPPGPQTGSFSIFSGQTSPFGGGWDYILKDVATITVTVTATWTPSSGQTAATDPPPPSVWLYESAQAEWTYGMSGGSADDGLGEKTTGSTYGGGYASSGNAPPSTPPAHWKSYPVTGGKVTLPTRTLRAEGDSVATAQMPNGDECIAQIDSYTVNVHAQPYNWHITDVVNNNDGSLTYYYDWLSTSGRKADLTNCYMHEYVTYPGTQGTAQFPLDYTMPAPFSGTLHNPTVRPGTGSSGQPATDMNGGMDHQGMPTLSLTSPHVAGGFTATQTYEFDDTATGETNVVVPGPDSGPLSIVRSVYSTGGVVWYYSLTKSGYTVTKSI